MNYLTHAQVIQHLRVYLTLTTILQVWQTLHSSIHVYVRSTWG